MSSALNILRYFSTAEAMTWLVSTRPLWPDRHHLGHVLTDKRTLYFISAERSAELG
ncbi:hypothetical protein LJR175_006800 [Variovorax sp. LjRoot175]